MDSVQAGSGSRFSVLPAENATGNYVKIVQRVPVKIVFDHDAEHQQCTDALAGPLGDPASQSALNVWPGRKKMRNIRTIHGLLP